MIETLEALSNSPEKDGIPQPGKGKDEGKTSGDDPTGPDGSPS